jgi:hypothetical protein
MSAALGEEAFRYLSLRVCDKILDVKKSTKSLKKHLTKKNQ